jgi:sialate O-acetylesterase
MGEVWLCSGQSNMAKPLGFTPRQKPVINFLEESRKADHQEMRFFKVASAKSSSPQELCKGEWVVCSQKSVLSFSAVAYFFGRELHKNLQVPVGLIQSTWGGTPVEAWTPKDMMNNDQIIKRFEKYYSRFRADSIYYEMAMTDYNQGYLRDRPELPESIYFVKKPQKGISVLYNAMIAPLLNYRIAGVIWYQGESNVSNPDLYKRQFPNLISSWRKKWDREEFPFYFVQIAPFSYNDQFGVARISEAQREALSLPNTGMASTQALGCLHDIHPPFKAEVGRRLSLIALNKNYGIDSLSYSGPTFNAYQIIDSSIVIDIHPNGGKLFFSGDYGGKPSFYIAGDNRVFYPAVSRMMDEKIILNNPHVDHPRHFRYLWLNDSNPTLFNSLGLPAMSFRSDDWGEDYFEQ